MSDSMVERVKAAIAETFAPAINFNAPYAKVMLNMAARAAIEAMRVPTEAMRAYAGKDLCDGSGDDPDLAASIYGKMLDVALEEKP